jgi:hypothetical protein
MERSLYSRLRDPQMSKVSYAQKIVIASDFSDAPGARDRRDGPKSGQEFYEDLLRPKFVAAREAGGVLLVDLDGTWGYASSFVSGSFGALAREFGAEEVDKHLALKSGEDSILLEKIHAEIHSEGKRD